MSNGSSTSAGPCQTCPHEEFSWAIPAGILNALWSNIFPRLTAQRWAAGDPGVALGADAAALSAAAGALVGSAEFTQRRDAFVAYVASGGAIAPIRMAGHIGFDCVISDDGIDLFSPPRPGTVSELARFFVFRRTGRASIGLPAYLNGPISGIDTDSSTGPSQGVFDPNVLFQIIDNSGASNDCKEEVKTCLRNRFRRDLGGRDDPEISIEEIMCLLAPLRCWQVSGAVYRGIMTELPRVVASIWFEKENGINGPTSYTKRFPKQGDNGLRGILSERLETSIPDVGRMVFREYAPGEPNPRPANWVEGDVMITNRGIYVPKPPAVPTLQNLYAAITNGTGGNPVFTDSRRSV